MDLATLPYSEQLAAIDRWAAQGQQLDQLLLATAKLRDHEPLAHAFHRLSGSSALGQPPVVDALEQVLRELPDTGVQRLLREAEGLQLPPEQREVLVDCLCRTVQRLPMERLVAVCLIDRWLKNHAPEARRSLVQDAARRGREAARGGALEQLDEATLLQLPARELARLEREVQGQADAVAGLRERLRLFTGRVLEVLEGQPKSLSQANAEQLLARHVYTNPGHFLFELMQNAEDAGARSFEVQIDDQQVSVRHDGLDFDAKDVVGVLSIGQTTKGQEQIGLFGVGFKSIYEVCDRPRIYSSWFCFEIADVSIPRRVQPPDGWRPEQGTLLVLPLRDVDDRQRGPRRLLEHALALPPETLLTLDSLRRYHVTCGASVHTVLEHDAGAGRVFLSHEESERSHGYLVTADHFHHGGEDAPVARTPVLVGLALDSEGMPCPLQEGRATLYSYLPTAEVSGLRFLVHAHFTMTVDRERLDLDSSYNRWALAQAGELLARAARRLVSEVTGDIESAQRLVALLGVLPLQQELASPAFGVILERFVAEVADVALLPAAGGGWLRPGQAAVCDHQELIHVLREVDVTGQGRRLTALLGPRERQVALALGAEPFGPPELLSLMERTLHRQDDGAPPPDPWLRDGMHQLLDALGGCAHLPRERLARLPLLPDQQRRLFRPDAVWRASEELRQIYGHHVRPLLQSSLEINPTSPQARLLERLAPPTLGPPELLDDLADPHRAGGLLRLECELPQRLEASRRLLRYLARLPRGLLGGLGERALFLDQTGHARPLAGAPSGPDGAAMLAPGGGLGELLWSLPTKHDGGESWRPPLVHAELSQPFGALLRDLEARVLDLVAVLELLSSGRMQLSAADLLRLHRLLDAMHADLTPRILRQVAAAPIFADRRGRRRPLRGADAALIPADADLVTLAPDAPWLQRELVELPYILHLGTEPVGARAVVQAMLLERDDLLDGTSDQGLRRAYGYLAAHPGGLTPGDLEQLAEAPVWLDEGGRRQALDELRLVPEDPSLIRLYRSWGGFALMETEAPNGVAAVSALELAQALGLHRRVKVPDLELLVQDLVSRPPSQPAEPVRRALVGALARAADQLSAAQLRPLRRAPLYRDTDGLPGPLGAWGDAPEAGGCFRADGALSEALAHGSRRLLHPRDQQDLQPLLDRLKIAPATVKELVAALEQDPALARPEACLAARAALVSERAALAEAFPPAGQQGHPRLAALAIWPRDAKHSRSRPAPARELLLAGDLRRLLGDDWRRVLVDAGELLLDASAEADAASLAGIVAFGDPMQYLVTRVEAEALVGQPLEQQPPFLGSVERLLWLQEAVLRKHGARAAAAMPLALDARQRLARPPLFEATYDEHQLLRGLILLDRLGHPGWAAGARSLDPELAPRLDPRRVLGALADGSREALELEQATAPPGLCAEPQRRRLYRWLLDHREALADDGQALGLLGRAHLMPSAGGVLRTPRDLLLEPGLPDLGIDWSPAAEVPEELGRWFQQVFRLQEQHLVRLLEHLLAAHQEAAARRDGERSNELLDFFTRALRVSHDELAAAVERLPRRIKLRRQLQVEAEDGRFRRPRSLLAVPDRQWELILQFCAAPPERVSHRYSGTGALALIRAAGASGELGSETLLQLLAGEGLRPGEQAAVALARYVAQLAQQHSQLRQVLQLDRRAWIPDGAGCLRPPGELYWPDAATEALVGQHPAQYPHPELCYTVPAQIRGWLPFRTVDNALLEDVLGQLEHDTPAPVEVLRWLEQGLAQRRIEAPKLRAALRGMACIYDDDGLLRPPEELLLEDAETLFGPRRGSWREGRDYPRLASALRIPGQPGARQVLAYMAEVIEDLETSDGRTLVQQEPELAFHLPHCLALLGGLQRRISPQRLVVAAEDQAGQRELCLASDPRLLLADAEDQVPDETLFPLLPDMDEQAVVDLLRRCGVPEPGAEPLPPFSWQGPEADQLELESPAPRQAPPPPVPAAPTPRHTEDSLLDTPEPLPEEQPEEQGPGLLMRIRNWLRGDRLEQPEPPAEEPEDLEQPEGREPTAGDPPARPRFPQPRQRRQRRQRKLKIRQQGRRSAGPPADPQEDIQLDAEEQARWFRPRSAIGPQMEGDLQWLARMQVKPQVGFAFTPRRLPSPYLYAPQLLAHTFDPRHQRWQSAVVDPAWSSPAAVGQFPVTFEGRVPGGSVVLPVPLYGRVVRKQHQAEARWLDGREGQVMLLAREATDLRYTVHLDRAPHFSRQVQDLDHEVDPTLLQPTAPDDELPLEVHDLVQRVQQAAMDPFARAMEVREFICANYRYDPSYLLDPELARWLRSVTRRRQNMHVAALHAGRDASHLGRGVCYELNSLACEMLRRVGVPAAMAVGWTLDQGSLSVPDHMWAMALLPSDVGLRWYPVDASVTRSGRLRHAVARAPGSWRVHSPERGGAPPPTQAEPRARFKRRRKRKGPPLHDMVRVIRYLESVTGSSAVDGARLHELCRGLLTDPAAAQELLRLVTRDEDDNQPP